MTNLQRDIQKAQYFLYETKDYNKGYKYALKAFMSNNKNPDTMYMYAVALYFNDRCEEALEYFYKLETINWHLDALYIYIAHCHSKLQYNLLKGLKYINKAINNFHYNEETQIKVLMIKAEILYRMGEFDTALKIFLKAYDMGDDDKSLCYIAKIYLLKNNFMKAMKYLRILYHFENNNPNEIWSKIQKFDTKKLLELLEDLLDRYKLKRKS